MQVSNLRLYKRSLCRSTPRNDEKSYLPAKYIAEHERREQHQQDNDADGNVHLILACAAFHLHLLWFWIAANDALGQTQNDGKGEHGSGDLVHRLNEEVCAQYSRPNALAGLEQICGDEG